MKITDLQLRSLLAYIAIGLCLGGTVGYRVFAVYGDDLRSFLAEVGGSSSSVNTCTNGGVCSGATSMTCIDDFGCAGNVSFGTCVCNVASSSKASVYTCKYGTGKCLSPLTKVGAACNNDQECIATNPQTGDIPKCQCPTAPVSAVSSSKSSSKSSVSSSKVSAASLSSKSSSKSSIKSSSVSSVPPLTCCTCYYQPYPECKGLPQAKCVNRECNDGKDNDGDGKKDTEDPQCDPRDDGTSAKMDNSERDDEYQPNNCTWHNNTCTGINDAACGLDFAANTCQTTRKIPWAYGSPTVPYPALPVCTETKDFTELHGSQSVCSSYLSTVAACVQCNTAACQSYINASCEVFADDNNPLTSEQDRAINSLKLIQQKMPSTVRMVIIAGNQTVVTHSCTTTKKFTLTEVGINTTFGACNFGANCVAPNQEYTCTDTNGDVMQGTCCSNPKGGTPAFVRMPATDEGECPATESTGVCGVTANGITCSDAAVSAWAGTNTSCLAQSKSCTTQHPGAIFSRTCNGSLVSSAWYPPMCMWQINCNWKCDW